MSHIEKVDCRGLACPQPVISAKKALDRMESGTVITLVDNEVAKENVSLFARNAGYSVAVEKEQGGYSITITKGSPAGNPGERPGKSAVTPRQADAGVVYFITSNVLGQGSPDLGMTLMKSLMVTLAEMNPPPKALIFLNTGVYLPCEGSGVQEMIKSIAEKEVEVLACGTCLDYYKLKEKLSTGRVSNMYEINSYLAGPHKVITIA